MHLSAKTKTKPKNSTTATVYSAFNVFYFAYKSYIIDHV